METRHNWFSKHQTIWITATFPRYSWEEGRTSYCTMPLSFNRTDKVFQPTCSIIMFQATFPYIVISYPIFDRFTYNFNFVKCNLLTYVALTMDDDQSLPIIIIWQNCGYRMKKRWICYFSRTVKILMRVSSIIFLLG